MRCVYCEHPLLCRACEVEFEPADQAQYEAIAQPETPVFCPACEAVLVCKWCKTPYDGDDQGEA